MAEFDADSADAPGRFRRALSALGRLDGRDGVVRAARMLRARLPGDHAYGDPLSVAGDEPPQLIARRLAAVTDRRPSAVLEKIEASEPFGYWVAFVPRSAGHKPIEMIAYGAGGDRLSTFTLQNP